MRIQEMRSASEVFKRRVEPQADQTDDPPESLDESVLTLHPRDVPASTSELQQPIWSVVCFDGIEAGGLKYRQAVELMRELESHGIAGLCVITDAAARRITN
jgi:hypothetical protein